MKRILAFSLVSAAFVAALAIAMNALSPDSASAGAPGSIDNLSIDMDPGSSPANTATSVGSIQSCAEINRDGDTTGDSDEDATDTVYFDVVVHPNGIPSGSPGSLGGIGFSFEYDQAVVRVADATGGAGTDHAFLGHSAGGTDFFDLDEPRPDTDGTYNESVIFNAPYANGPGILVRLGIEAIAAGPAVVTLTIPNDPSLLILDDGGGTYTVTNVNNAIVVVDDAGGCDDTDGDGTVNALDTDDDGDGVLDGPDLCEGTASAAAVDSDGCSDAQVDGDGDGICDPAAPGIGPSECTGTDNCPSDANPAQENLDGDAFGDACDSDTDGDGFSDTDEDAAGSDALDANSVPEGEAINPGSCSDGEDNDGDGDVDTADAGCQVTPTPGAGTTPGATPTRTPSGFGDSLGGPSDGGGLSWLAIVAAGLLASAVGSGVLAYHARKRGNAG